MEIQKNIHLFDGHFVYRAHNIIDFRLAGAKYVEHCPPCYDPCRHNLINSSFLVSESIDAAFIGHWENDERCHYLDMLNRSGFNVVIKGSSWDKAVSKTSLSFLLPIGTSFGDEYNDIYRSSLAGLCFFRS